MDRAAPLKQDMVITIEPGAFIAMDSGVQNELTGSLA